MIFFITSFFSISALHVRLLLPRIIQNISSEGLKSSSTNKGLILDQCNGKIKLITLLCCPFRTNYRKSHLKCSMKKSVLRIYTEFRGKHLCQFLFFNKVEALSPAILLKKRLWHRCFCEISQNTPFTEHLWTTASVITRIFIDTCIVKINTKFVAQKHIQNHAKYPR